MLRKFFVGAAIVAGSLASSAPAMAATEPVPGGVYPDIEAAQAACDAGIAQGRWDHCAISAAADQERAVMWVWSD